MVVDQNLSLIVPNQAAQCHYSHCPKNITTFNANVEFMLHNKDECPIILRTFKVTVEGVLSLSRSHHSLKFTNPVGS